MPDEVVFWLPPLDVPLLKQDDNAVVTGRADFGVICPELCYIGHMTNTVPAVIILKLGKAPWRYTLHLLDLRHSARKETRNELPGHKPFHQADWRDFRQRMWLLTARCLTTDVAQR